MMQIKQDVDKEDLKDKINLAKAPNSEFVLQVNYLVDRLKLENKFVILVGLLKWQITMLKHWNRG